MRENLQLLFQRTYRELRPRAPMPDFRVEFYAFANINSTIRLRESTVHVRISDLLEGAPESVIEAIAHILLAKIYRKPIESFHAVRYRRYVSSHDMTTKAHLVRQVRGRKRIDSARGFFYDLEEIFETLNRQFFHGLLARPLMTWSRLRARTVSRTTTRPTTPSSSAVSSITPAYRATQWNTSSTTRCFT